MGFTEMFVLMLWVFGQGETMSACCTVVNVLNQEKGYLSSDIAQNFPALRLCTMRLLKDH